jgi:hypothetical protein
MPTIRKTKITNNNEDTWMNASTYFENGDGTRYLFHFMPARHGGIYIIANETEVYRYHGNADIKFLCGNHNKYTEKAVLQLIQLAGYDEIWRDYL